MKAVSLYARVSSRKQARERTIESQVAELERRISEEEHELLEEYKFIDNGYSGSSLERPGLDRLRDKVKEGKIDKIYIHSPDRLSRNYIYQMILLEEFQKAGVEVIFLNHKTDSSPESNLLLQMQGAIAEYERAKITERNRRGRVYEARIGSVSAMCKAPYGYRYIKRGPMNEKGKFEIDEEKAEVVKKLFTWVGEERVSIMETARRLKGMSIRTRTGKEMWDCITIRCMLRNPAYKGQAAFGKTKVCRVIPKGNAAVQGKDSIIRTGTDKENWIYIPVPKIVDEELFNAVQEQLDRSREMVEAQKRRTSLLQGLVVCQRCRYAYCGIHKKYKKEQKGYSRNFYRCNKHHRDKTLCDNKSTVNGDVLEITVWEKVKSVLKQSERLINEYKRKLSENKKRSLDEDLERQESKLKQEISRLIDNYAQEYVSQEEFELSIKTMRQWLQEIEEKKERVKDQRVAQQELTAIINSIKEFSDGIKSEIDQYNWSERRNVIRALVERIEINLNSITIIFRIKESVSPNGEKQNMQPIVIKQRIVRTKSRSSIKKKTKVKIVDV